MCGLTGFWDFSANVSTNELLATVQSMSNLIQERGPDSFGVWCDEIAGLAFGHRRLAIVDLSPAGHQPMLSHSGKSSIAYNGEIYNALELRKKLIQEGCTFRGYSDTEVILEACERWGVVAACQQFIGMFAFSFWDKVAQKLYLARDRLGIKPLYWGFQQGILFFGSQVKSFTSHQKWDPKLDRDALATYFRFNYVPAPLSIYKDIQKLSPGVVLSVDASKNVQEFKFWDFQKIAQQNKNHRQYKSDLEWTNECELLLKDAVKRRMIADVPFGALLSGGIDSSTVVALMQAESSVPIKTFSIGFHEAGYNEATYAALVAKFLKTDHHELYLNSNEAQAIIPDIPNWFDEPFADVSQIPTFLVSQLAVKHVKVSLSGDGGDELFAGYNRYLFGQNLWQKITYLPLWMRCIVAKGIQQFSPQAWTGMARILPASIRPKFVGDKAYKFAEILETSDPFQLYKMLVSQWDRPDDLVLQGKEKVVYPWKGAKTAFNRGRNFIEIMQEMDLLSYLPDDILTKVDRASMAVGLEVRVPLLDHRLVEFSSGLPMNVKIRGNQTKWLLRQVLDRYVPKKLIDRPKMGFGVPIDQWLRGPLREWAEGLLSSERLQKDGVLDPFIVRKRWEEHLSGRRNWQSSLWGVLMFQAWHSRWMG